MSNLREEEEEEGLSATLVSVSGELLSGSTLGPRHVLTFSGLGSVAWTEGDGAQTLSNVYFIFQHFPPETSTQVLPTDLEPNQEAYDLPETNMSQP